MKTPITSRSAKLFLLPVMAGSLLFVQCSSGDSTADTMQENSADRTTGMVEPVTQSDLNAEVNATYNDQTGDIRTTNGTSADGTVNTTTVVVYTPAKERMMVTNDMRGLRSLLMADLEAVRTRLNDGARPKVDRDADVALAADLAQGLERVDRALAALGASNDATWTTIRDAQVKEVAEVRSWMADYRAKSTWAMK
ncbi:MAG TPA: hypothetical protein PL070_05700 [Flavobacteriales bacterium]|nr:hypothetical protein [Flavobacteriales bacterium]